MYSIKIPSTSSSIDKGILTNRFFSFKAKRKKTHSGKIQRKAGLIYLLFNQNNNIKLFIQPKQTVSLKGQKPKNRRRFRYQTYRPAVPRIVTNS